MKTCDHYKTLLMGLIDQELTPEESAEVHDHLIRCAACRQEYEQLGASSDPMRGLSFVEPQDEVLRTLWRSPYSRLVRQAGLWLVLGGYASLLAYALYAVLVSRDEPILPRIALASVITGFALLLLQVIRERMRTYKTDPYKEIQR